MKLRCAKILLLAGLVLWAGGSARAADTNTLIWPRGGDRVSADLYGEALWPLLEDIARQTGWHIFVEPDASHNASVKFSDLPVGEALQKLLGTLNYALMPQTNGPAELYVFTTSRQNATRRVAPARPRVTAMRHAANQLLVHLKPGADIDAIAKSRGARVVSRNDKLGIYLLEFDSSAATDSALAGLKVDPNIASVDYNYIYDAPVTPQPLATAPAGAGPLTLTPSSNTANDPCNPIIGLIDTAFPSLGSQLDPFVLPSTNVTGIAPVLSTNSPTHGYAMAQTILTAIQNQLQKQAQNPAQKQGVSSSVRILPVDVYGSGETTSTWDVALGVQAAVDGGATVLNMSLAGTTDDAVLDDIIQQALARGIVIFAAAGNQPVSTPNYPAAIPGVNAVTALGAPGQLASYADYGSFVEMALPGSSVVYLGSQAFVVQGTSASTAYASGLAAGAKSVNCLPWPQIEGAMQQQFPVPQTGN